MASRGLVAAADPDLAGFLRGLAALPLRPGALAALDVSSFDQKLHVLKIGKDKHWQDRKLKLGERVGNLFSDLVHQGLELLTVAQISGTTVAMIELVERKSGPASVG